MSKIRSRFPEFWPLHERIKDVTFENQSWEQIVYDFDNKDAVFYMDPPYLTAYRGTYKHEMTQDDHRRLLDTIMGMKAFVAISGFENELYDKYDWDERHTWPVHQSIKGMAFHEENQKAGHEVFTKRDDQEEVLWIKRH